MQKILRRIEIMFLTGLLFFTVAGFFVPNNAAAQLRADDPSTSRPLPVYSGVEDSIKEYLCAPGDSQDEQATALTDCISKLYRFSITAGGVALVFFIVIAGYIYITSGEAGKGRAKDIILSAVVGMGILLGSYALLNFINPNLVKIRPIQPPIFTATGLPSCEAVGFGTKCITRDGQVSNPGGGVPGSASEAQYKDLISKYAQQKGLSYCALSALIQKESSFIYNNVSNPPPSRVDVNSGSPPSYNVTFTTGHGIGLTQVYIYPGQTSRPGGEFGFSKALTVQDLINPDTSISAGAHFFGTLVRERRNNLREAYDDYQAGRGGNSDPKTLDKYMDMYNACQLRN